MTLWQPMQMRKSLKRASVSLDRWKPFSETITQSILWFAIFSTTTRITVKTCWQVRRWLLRILALSLWRFTSVSWSFVPHGRKRWQSLWPPAIMTRKNGDRLSGISTIRTSLQRNSRTITALWKSLLLLICGWPDLMCRLLPRCMFTSLCPDTILCRQSPV